MTHKAPLVLTLKLDQSTFDRVNGLRQQHFPPERNFLPAHITLFHALPGDQVLPIQRHLQTLCADTSRMPLQFSQLRFLGKGVAIECSCSVLIQLQKNLMQFWKDWLTPQDRQNYRPHITIQNKVAPEEARMLYEQMQTNWHPFEGNGEGLLLWYYRGGPWELVEEFPFLKSSPAVQNG
jgi:2'-5' RNA ligase